MTNKRKVKEPDWSKAWSKEWESYDGTQEREFRLYFTRKGKLAKVQRQPWRVRLRGKSQENSAPFFEVVKTQAKSKKKGSRWGRPKYGRSLYYVDHPLSWRWEGAPFENEGPDTWKGVVDYMEKWGKLAYITKRKGQYPKWCIRGYTRWCFKKGI